MIDTPFQTTISLSERQQRTLALAAVFQSAQLAHLLAYGDSVYGEHPASRYFIASMQACLNIQTGTITNRNPLLYFQMADLSCGLQALERSLTQPFSTSPKSRLPQKDLAKYPTSYALALLQLEKKVYKNPEFIQKIEQMRQQVIKQLSFFDYQYLHQNIIANLAQCYSQTASTLKPRIMIKGYSEALKNQQQANMIRAALLTGLQAAHLWRQLGGSSWGFVFGKAKIVMDIRELIKLQYQQNKITVQSE